VFVEAPGSLSFEMQDIPAIAEAAHARGAVVLMDNTWASPLYFRAFDQGVDLSIQAATKYIGGHSDVMLGAVSANKATLERLIDSVHALGLCVGPDDVYLALRGLRTMGVRLAQHDQSGRKVARDFSGASGLFSIVFKPVPDQAVHAFLNELRLFGMGASWGGFESLAIPFDCTAIRTATKWAPGGPTVRIHIGLEDVDDLIGDLERGFAALAAAK
jgi:cystathionine beta-lyase